MFSSLRMLAAALLLFSGTALAQDLEFDSVTEGDLEKVVRDFSSIFHHTSVSGANTLGSVFGFEVGLIGGLGKVNSLDDVVQDADPDADVPGLLPHGGLLGILSVPFGWTFELSLIPEFGDDGFAFSNTTAAVKWSLTESVLSALPLSIALKGHYSQTKINFEQEDPSTPGVTVDGTYESTVTGLQAVVSKDLLVVSPYAALGFLQASGDLGVNGSGSIFDTDFTSSDSASVNTTSTQLIVGAEVKLLLMKLAAEYSRQFDTERFTAKFSLYF
ncbi:MAG: hypothetical protein HRT45_13935 [Bdellovibrionales bacterium]|nr:hypothetical protein [Bdellovibrionales bacterium]